MSKEIISVSYKEIKRSQAKTLLNSSLGTILVILLCLFTHYRLYTAVIVSFIFLCGIFFAYITEHYDIKSNIKKRRIKNE